MRAQVLKSPAAWWNPYIGLRFRDHGRDLERDGGIDCFGLVRWVYLRVLGIELPTYLEEVDQSISLNSQLPALHTAFMAGASAWIPVPAGQHRPFDVVEMRRGSIICHVGIITKPEAGRMLHIEQGINSCLEDYASGYWARRVVGVYRHA